MWLDLVTHIIDVEIYLMGQISSRVGFQND